MEYDIVIVGGGPGGLSAALALGRVRKRVLLCDAGERRNAAATHLHNFVTRDGTPPEEFRRVAREQLARYGSVEIRDTHVASVDGERGRFRLRVGSEVIEARRILLCTGMIDEVPEVLRALWGRAIFQCPYCHGWEVQDRRWGYVVLTSDAHLAMFVTMLRGWTRDVVVFAEGTAVPELTGVRIETSPIARLVARDDALEAVELRDGRRVPCDVLFTHPPQRQVELVASLGVELDEAGYVRTDPMTLETSVPGIYAAGDLTTRAQGAIFAAAAGARAAGMINVELAMEDV